MNQIKNNNHKIADNSKTSSKTIGISDNITRHKTFAKQNAGITDLEDKHKKFSQKITRRNHQITLTDKSDILPEQFLEAEPLLKERLEQIREGTDQESLNVDSGEPVPFILRNRYEEQFGMNFSNIRLHTDPPSMQFAKQQRAHAVTIKHHIFADPEKLNLEKSTGRALLGHELTHVVQQADFSKDRVLSPSNQNKLENEALMQEQNTLSMEKGVVPKKISSDNGLSKMERQHLNPQVVFAELPKSPPVVNSITDAVPMAAAIDRTLPEIPKENNSLNHSEITQQLYADLKLKLQTEKERSGV